MLFQNLIFQILTELPKHFRKQKKKDEKKEEIAICDLIMRCMLLINPGLKLVSFHSINKLYCFQNLRIIKDYSLGKINFIMEHLGIEHNSS